MTKPTISIGGLLHETDRLIKKRFDRFAAALRFLNPAINRLPLKMLYVPWAYEGWLAADVDPRWLHNGVSGATPGSLSYPEGRNPHRNPSYT